MPAATSPWPHHCPTARPSCGSGRSCPAWPRRSCSSTTTGRDRPPASRAACADGGYTDVAVLVGGIAGWAAAGHELITGLNSLSKALGEFVERHYETPRIKAEELKTRLDGGEDLVILDTRPIPEFTHISIPTGQAAPGVELLYRIFDRVLTPTTQVVINCAGRTGRSSVPRP